MILRENRMLIETGSARHRWLYNRGTCVRSRSAEWVGVGFFTSTFFYFFKNPQFLTIPSDKGIVLALILVYIFNDFSSKMVESWFWGDLRTIRSRSGKTEGGSEKQSKIVQRNGVGGGQSATFPQKTCCPPRQPGLAMCSSSWRISEPDPTGPRYT